MDSVYCGSHFLRESGGLRDPSFQPKKFSPAWTFKAEGPCYRLHLPDWHLLPFSWGQDVNLPCAAPP